MLQTIVKLWKLLASIIGNICLFCGSALSIMLLYIYASDKISEHKDKYF
ncbi:MAG: hypothetical protein VZS44_08250 [Bacilli bacterium]|nr:hypothetical protein [Bacilli bacterium]